MHEGLSHLNPSILAAITAESANLHLLLDGALIDAPKLVYGHDDAPRVEQLYRGTRHEKALAVSPYLAKPSAGSRLWAIKDAWQFKGILLATNASFEQLADHLRSLISMSLPSSQLAYCRFYSPQWLVRLLRSTTPEDFIALSGPISQWIARTEDGWLSMKPAAAGQSRRAEEEGWFSLRQDQLDLWAEEEHQKFIERAVSHLRCEDKQSAAGKLQRQHIVKLTAMAREMGFIQEHHCLHYLELAWRFPNDITNQSLSTHFGNQSSSPGQRLQEAERHLFGLV
ncbi:hypothetical protein LCGC14_0762990 [marine sediment metagenome]|nr:DUF4123 domain-containing protein [Marinobacter antarcticus]